MKRREFLSRAGLGALAAGGLLTGCQKKEQEAQKAAAGAVAPTAEAPQEWTLLSAWPDDFPLLGESAHTLGKLITELSGGRVQVQVAQTQNPADVFDQVAAGKAQLGYGMGSLWHEKDPAFELFSSIPFGLAPREINGWLYEGNGLSLWQQAYKKYGIVPYPAGNTGLQMAGWFRKPLKKAGDLKGLRIRIDGLGAQAMKQAGAHPVDMPLADAHDALAAGRLDAVVWMAPYHDLQAGLYQAAKFYHYPGWQAPGETLECLVNAQALEALPANTSSVIASACSSLMEQMLAAFDSRNAQALDTLITTHGVKVEPLPREVLNKLRVAAEQAVGELASDNDLAGSVYESYLAFKQRALAWSDVSQRAYLNSRLDYKE